MIKIWRKQTVRYELKGKRASAGTPQAVRVVVQSKRWYGTITLAATAELRAMNDWWLESILLRSISFYVAMESIGFGPTLVNEEMPTEYNQFQWGEPPPSFRQFSFAKDLGLRIVDGMTRRDFWLATKAATE